MAVFRGDDGERERQKGRKKDRERERERKIERNSNNAFMYVNVILMSVPTANGRLSNKMSD